MSTVSDWAGLIAPVTTLAGVLGGYWLADTTTRVATFEPHSAKRRRVLPTMPSTCGIDATNGSASLTESRPPAQSAVLSVMAGQARNSYAGRSTRSARC